MHEPGLENKSMTKTKANGREDPFEFYFLDLNSL